MVMPSGRRSRSGSARRPGRRASISSTAHAAPGQAHGRRQPGQPGADDVDVRAAHQSTRPWRSTIQSRRALPSLTRVARRRPAGGFHLAQDLPIDLRASAAASGCGRRGRALQHRVGRGVVLVRLGGHPAAGARRCADRRSPPSGRGSRCRRRPAPRAADRAGRSRRPRRGRAGCWSAAGRGRGGAPARGPGRPSMPKILHRQAADGAGHPVAIEVERREVGRDGSASSTSISMPSITARKSSWLRPKRLHVLGQEARSAPAARRRRARRGRRARRPARRARSSAVGPGSSAMSSTMRQKA